MKRLLVSTLLLAILISSSSIFMSTSNAADAVILDSWAISGGSGHKAYKVKCGSGKVVTIKQCASGTWATSCGWGGTYNSFERAVKSYC